MGTNYYLILNKCKCCGRSDKFHIGKQSYGWQFLFQYIKDKAESFEQWKALLKQGEITDEYDKPIDYMDFLNMVMENTTKSSESEENKDSGVFRVSMFEFCIYDFL